MILSVVRNAHNDEVEEENTMKKNTVTFKSETCQVTILAHLLCAKIKVSLAFIISNNQHTSIIFPGRVPVYRRVAAVSVLSAGSKETLCCRIEGQKCSQDGHHRIFR